jgi:hypothetical protein
LDDPVASFVEAACVPRDGVTRLLLERGANPNDEETPYHVPETTDNWRASSFLAATMKWTRCSCRPTPHHFLTLRGH